jgi:hypothetical protein
MKEGVMYGGMTLLADEDRKQVIELINKYNTLLPTVIDLEHKYDTYIKQIEILEQNQNDNRYKYNQGLNEISNNQEQIDTLRLLTQANEDLLSAYNNIKTYVERTILNNKNSGKEINKKFNDVYYKIGSELRTFISSINTINTSNTKPISGIEISPLTKRYEYDITIVILKNLLKIKNDELA